MQGESKRLLSRDVEAGEVARPGNPKPQKEKAPREWPVKLRSFFFLFVFLGAGVLIGVVASFHLMGVLKTDRSYFSVDALGFVMGGILSWSRGAALYMSKP